MFQRKVVDKILKNYVHFFTKNHAFYEVMWKNIVEPDRTHRAIL
jgi:hypothetical protein